MQLSIHRLLVIFTLGALAFLSQSLLAATSPHALLPQSKKAFYADEPIELAVAGLAKNAVATVALVIPLDVAYVALRS